MRKPNDRTGWLRRQWVIGPQTQPLARDIGGRGNEGLIGPVGLTTGRSPEIRWVGYRHTTITGEQCLSPKCCIMWADPILFIISVYVHHASFTCAHLVSSQVCIRVYILGLKFWDEPFRRWAVNSTTVWISYQLRLKDIKLMLKDIYLSNTNSLGGKWRIFESEDWRQTPTKLQMRCISPAYKYVPFNFITTLVLRISRYYFYRIWCLFTHGTTQIHQNGAVKYLRCINQPQKCNRTDLWKTAP